MPYSSGKYEKNSSTIGLVFMIVITHMIEMCFKKLHLNHFGGQMLRQAVKFASRACGSRLNASSVDLNTAGILPTLITGAVN